MLISAGIDHTDKVSANRPQSRAMPGGGSFDDDVARVAQLEQVVDMYKKQLDEMQRDSQAAEERIIEGHGLVKQAVLDEVQAMLKERQTCEWSKLAHRSST